MSGFLYYFTGKGVNYDPCDGKLSYAFEEKPALRGCQKGPDGEKGVVARVGGGDLGYYPERQKWQEVAYLGCWVGYETEEPPKESDVRRGKMLSGGQVKIDGELWTIPIARSFEDDETGGVSLVSRLSQYLLVDYSTGEWGIGGVEEGYKELWDVALKYWDYWSEVNLQGEDEPRTIEMSNSEVLDMAELVMRTNYRVSRVELSLRNWISADICREVLEVVIDIASMEELLKKRESPLEVSGTGNGKPAAIEDTLQPSLTG